MIFRTPKLQTKISWHERVIQANIIKHFLAVFRDTQDVHRVLIIIPLTLLLSHSYFLKTAPQVSLAVARISRDEMLWLGLEGFIILFVLSWAVFSSEFNPALYFRQSIIAGWSLLIHRLFYGLTELGSADFYTLAFLAFSYFLPFALTGLGNAEFFQKLKENRDAKKQHPATIYENKNENDAV